MKTLTKFRESPVVTFDSEPSMVEEISEKTEKQDYSKFDALVRAGLANKAQLRRIHSILDKMQEEKPTFNNADRAILQNLFNRMVDLLTTNKQIFNQARQKVNESTVTTSDYKVSPTTGRKYKAHRFSVSEKEPKDQDDLKEGLTGFDPPYVLVLKRKAIRLYPDSTRIALYYSDKLNKYFSVPYTTEDNSGAIQAEQVELEESVMDQLHKIVNDKQAQRVKFGDGTTRKVDHFTASAITQVHKALNDENKKKFADMVHKSPAHLAKASDFAFKRAK